MTKKVSRREALVGAASIAAFSVAGSGIIASETKNEIDDEATAEPKVHEVAIKKFKFDPAEIEVAVGDTIRWTNLDLAPHTATAIDKSWDTKRIKKKKSAEISVTADMELEYFCAFHPHMKATIKLV